MPFALHDQSRLSMLGFFEKSNLSTAVLAAFILATPGGVLFGYGVGTLLLALGVPDVAIHGSDAVLPQGWTLLAVAILVGPLLETLALSVALMSIGRLGRQGTTSCGVVALLFSMLHYGNGIASMAVNLWNFFIWSMAYTGRAGKGWHQAFLAAALPHALHNLTVLTVARLAA